MAKPTSKEEQYLEFFSRTEHTQRDYELIKNTVYRTDIYDGPEGGGEVHYAFRNELGEYYCLRYTVGSEKRNINLEWEKLDSVPDKVKELLP